MCGKPIDIGEMRDIASRFRIGGEATAAEPYGSGHINDTYAVYFRGAPRSRYLFQRVNHRIFRNIPALMENICRATEHIRRKLARVPGADAQRETLTVIPAECEGRFFRSAAGDYWRAYLFIEDAWTHDVAQNNRQIYEAAKAFGRFQALLADLPPPPLHETIADFHHTPRRFAALEQAAAADLCARAAACGPELEFAFGLRPLANRITNGLESGELARRVTHNDTKLNNVMIDHATGRGVCVIDLDTVMPGSPLYDFGDQVRTATGRFAEDERDLAQVHVDLARFEQLVKGTLETARDTLSDREIDLLWLGGVLMTFECGIRFLADYLQGDVYFKVHRRGENLDRCRTQFELVRSMQQNENAMRQIVRKCR